MAKSSRFHALRPPPRSVPLLLRLHVLFGGVVQQMGWLFFGIGVIFTWIFVGDSELVTMFRFRGRLEVVPGTVTAIEETGASENDNTVYRVRYRYDYAGSDRDGASYTLDPSVVREGATVDVEVVPSSPDVSRIAGMRHRSFSAWVAFVLIFPSIGLIMVLATLPGGLRGLRLLRNGQLAFGKLIAKEETSTRVNEQPVVRYTFEFTDHRGMPRRAVANTHAGHAIEDEAEEAILFDPDRLDEAIVCDALPGGATLDERGELRSEHPVLALLSVVFPAIALTAWGSLFLFGL